MIDVNGDLLGATLGSDMLSTHQRGSAAVPGKPDQILRNQRYRTPRTFLPGSVTRRIDDRLTNDPPSSMVRITTRNQKACERLRHLESFRLCPMTIQVPQRGSHFTAVLHRPGQIPRAPPRLASFVVDACTVPSRRAAWRHPRGRGPADNHIWTVHGQRGTPGAPTLNQRFGVSRPMRILVVTHSARGPVAAGRPRA